MSVSETIFIKSHPNIIRRTNFSSVLISSILIITGMLMLIFAFKFNEQNSNFNIFLMVFGTILFFYGLFNVLWKSNKMIYEPTNSVTKESSLFFGSNHLNSLIQSLENADFSSEKQIKSENSGNIRLDSLTSKDGSYAIVQLFKFVPYAYEPVTTIFYFNGDKAKSFHSFLKSCKR